MSKRVCKICVLQRVITRGIMHTIMREITCVLTRAIMCEIMRVLTPAVTRVKTRVKLVRLIMRVITRAKKTVTCQAISAI